MKVFISHSSTDKKFVRTLKDDLIENNIETWLDEDELEIGDSLAEKLDYALDKSSHFLLILSPSAVNSEWVKIEIQKALSNHSNKSIKKILPVKYKDCVVPDELSHLLFADLSNETRHIEGDKIKFSGTEYSNFLDKLCKAIKGSVKKLTMSDKTEIKKEFLREEKQNEIDSVEPNIIKTNYMIIGYPNLNLRLNYAKKILTRSKNKKLILAQIRPIFIPPLLKNVFKDINYGDKIFFSKNYLFNEIGHFAGYKKNDLGIIIDGRIRKNIGLKSNKIYNVEINIYERRFNFIE